MQKINQKSIDSFIRIALQEDIGPGDITTASVIRQKRKGTGRLIAKETMVVAGLGIAERVFQILDRKVDVRILVQDGCIARAGDVLATVRGNIISLLKGERVMLNILQRLSGIATLTRKYVDKIEGTHCRILDTRKTTPGMRILEKYAVRTGGGYNHRFGLFDAILIKNNHIAAAGSVKSAIQNCRKGGYAPEEIEIEVRTLQELKEALSSGAKRILLDNMRVRQIRKAVILTRGKAILEASGNITLNNARKAAMTGVDFISAGALTRSVTSMDISFSIEPTRCTQK